MDASSPEPRLIGKHEGRWRVCLICGSPENQHPYRRPFVPLQPDRAGGRHRR